MAGDHVWECIGRLERTDVGCLYSGEHAEKKKKRVGGERRFRIRGARDVGLGAAGNGRRDWGACLSVALDFN